MRKDPRSIPTAFRGYLLPTGAHESLVHTRDQLRLLAQFTEARSEQREVLFVSSDALSELFDRIANHLDDSLAVIVRETPDADG